MEKIGVVVGLAAGILIGYYWPEIERVVGPVVRGVGDEVSRTITAVQRVGDEIARARATVQRAGDEIAKTIAAGLRYVAGVKATLEDKRAEAKPMEELDLTQAGREGV